MIITIHPEGKINVWTTFHANMAKKNQNSSLSKPLMGELFPTHSVCLFLEHCTTRKHCFQVHSPQGKVWFIFVHTYTVHTLPHTCIHTTTSGYMAQRCPPPSESQPGVQTHSTCFKGPVQPNCTEQKHHNLQLVKQREEKQVGETIFKKNTNKNMKTLWIKMWVMCQACRQTHCKLQNWQQVQNLHMAVWSGSLHHTTTSTMKEKAQRSNVCECMWNISADWCSLVWSHQHSTGCLEEDLTLWMKLEYVNILNQERSQTSHQLFCLLQFDECKVTLSVVLQFLVSSLIRLNIFFPS